MLSQRVNRGPRGARSPIYKNMTMTARWGFGQTAIIFARFLPPQRKQCSQIKVRAIPCNAYLKVRPKQLRERWRVVINLALVMTDWFRTDSAVCSTRAAAHSPHLCSFAAIFFHRDSMSHPPTHTPAARRTKTKAFSWRWRTRHAHY